MGTTGSGAVLPGGAGEGPWWLVASGSTFTLDVQAGDVFAVWGSLQWIDGVANSIDWSGGGIMRVIIGTAGQATFMQDSCAYTGMLIHQVLSPFGVVTGCT